MRLIDADTLSKKLCETTIFIKDGEVFQRMINDAPTVPVVDITQRDLCKDISCTDCPFMKETCKLMDCVAYADRPHGEWYNRDSDGTWATVDFAYCSECKQPIIHKHASPLWHFCPNCGADMRKENK